MKRLVLCLFLGAAAFAQSSHPITPSEPGMYVRTGSGFTKIIGQTVTFTRTGSLLVSGITAGIKARKQNVQLLGAHSQTVVGSEPEFYFVPTRQEAEMGLNAGDLVLVRLEEKKERRQFEVAADGLWRASSGISITHQVQLFRSEEGAGTYRLTPGVGLREGEYAFYITRGEGTAPYIYDFSVNNGAASKADVKQAATDPKPMEAQGTVGVGTVVLTSDPSGVEVYADNSFVGNTPTILRLPPGQHFVRMFMKGYKNWSQQVTVQTGSETRITATLEKAE